MPDRQSGGWLKLSQILLGSALIGLCTEAIAASTFVTLIGCSRALAQISPDRTLGGEASVVNLRRVRGRSAALIEGGATRGASLFHSFSEFNVHEGQRVYFANPSGIELILSRVTGNDPSEILGTLGVNGGADLFLLNPNGIVFGPNARLDIRGSFVASTASSLQFENGLEFSATHPQAPPILLINSRPGLQYGSAHPQAAIASTGNLRVGEDLMLGGDHLLLEGQLQAGRDLTLHALDTVQIRDSVLNPFIASANGNLTVQGDRSVDISALNHPNSGFFSEGDLMLRSSGTVGGDAHYTTGGSFRIEQLNGRLGSLSSPDDPVIRAAGDVSFASYTGASLHIFAGGSVKIGSVEITGPDTANAISQTVTLSDGSTILVDGSTRPTLDIRAGTRAVGTPQGQAGSPAPTDFAPSDTASTADITIGSIAIAQPDGLVFLTNQYQPDPALGIHNGITVESIDLSSDTGAGDLTVDARGGITVNDAVNAVALTGAGGNLLLLSEGDINLNPGALLNSSGSPGGSIRLNSGGAIAIRNTDGAESITSTTTGSGVGGDINLTAQSISINDSTILTSLAADASGRSGNFMLSSGSLTADFATLATATEGQGDAGNVTVESNLVSINSGFIGSAVFPEAVGRGGDVTIAAEQISGINSGQVSSFTAGQGDAGNVTLNASNISFEGRVAGFSSGAFTSVLAGAVGNGGNLTVRAGTLSLTNGAEMTATTEGQGDAGNITIDAADSVFLDGVRDERRTNITSEALLGSEGQGGEIRVNTRSLSVTAGAFISAASAAGDAGDLSINATDSVLLAGTASLPDTSSGLYARTTAASTGNGGSIFVTSDNVAIREGAQIFVGSDGVGVGGRVQIRTNSLLLDRGTVSAETANTAGGDVTLRTQDGATLRHNSQISATAGTARGRGDGGNITINSDFVAAVASENSDITANAFEGRGGNIQITAQGVYGIEFRDRLTPLSDITATSQFGVNGVVQINQPDVDPSRGLVELPTNVIDASRLVAQGCSAGRGAIAQLGEFIITGRGGLPPSPTERLSGDAVLADWETLDSTADSLSSAAPVPTSPPTQITEAQGWVTTADGTFLVAQAPTATVHGSWVREATCR